MHGIPLCPVQMRVSSDIEKKHILYHDDGSFFLAVEGIIHVHSFPHWRKLGA